MNDQGKGKKDKRFFYLIYWKYLKKYKWSFLMGALAIVLINALDMLPPLIIKQVIDSLRDEGKLVYPLPLYLIIFIAMYFIMGLLRFSWRYFFMVNSRRVEADLKKDLFNKILYGRYKEVTKLNPGNVVSLLGQDLENFRMFVGPGNLIWVDMITYFIYVPAMVIYVLGPMGLLLLSPFLLIPFAMPTYEKVMNKLYFSSSSLLSKMSDQIYESTIGMKIFRVLAVLEIRKSKFIDLISELYQKRIEISKVDVLFDAIINVLSFASLAMLFIFAYYAAREGSPTSIKAFAIIGTIVLMVKTMEKIIWPMMAISYLASITERASASMGRLRDIFQITPFKNGSKNISGLIEEIKIEDLNFFYNEINKINETNKTMVLKNISIKAKKGEKIALVGDVGSGKSTLLKILSTLYENDDISSYLEYSFNQTPYSEIDLYNLRGRISYIPQEPVVFNNSILKNIDPYLHSDMNRVEQVLELVNLNYDLKQFPEGLSTYVGEKGVTLSGGQKQRLAMARSFYSGAQIFLWDDTISALDLRTEKKIIEGIDSLNENSILILATHRLSSLVNFDRIYVLSEGRVVEEGNFPQLMKSQREFYRLYIYQEKTIKLSSYGTAAEQLYD
ncbi:MAG: ABC transporter ATP-binding protein [Oligoflexia bacterium]|nr:ABC transporter ATP-binding protein [Oligoflexia bacterium]